MRQEFLPIIFLTKFNSFSSKILPGMGAQSPIRMQVIHSSSYCKENHLTLTSRYSEHSRKQGVIWSPHHLTQRRHSINIYWTKGQTATGPFLSSRATQNKLSILLPNNPLHNWREYSKFSPSPLNLVRLHWGMTSNTSKLNFLGGLLLLLSKNVKELMICGQSIQCPSRNMFTLNFFSTVNDYTSLQFVLYTNSVSY